MLVHTCNWHGVVVFGCWLCHVLHLGHENRPWRRSLYNVHSLYFIKPKWNYKVDYYYNTCFSFWDVNEELQMCFIVYGGHKQATGHLTKQDRNPNVFENNLNLVEVFFSVCSVCHMFVGNRRSYVKLTSWGFWKWDLIERTEVELIFHGSGLLLFVLNDEQVAFLTFGSYFLFDNWKWWTACTCWDLIY